MPRQIPGTGSEGVSYASATITSLPRTKLVITVSPVSVVRNEIEATEGLVVSAYGVRCPGWSGFTGRPPASSVRWTCSQPRRIVPRAVRSSSTLSPSLTDGLMCQYSNMRPLPESIRTPSVLTIVTLPDATG